MFIFIQYYSDSVGLGRFGLIYLFDGISTVRGLFNPKAFFVEKQ